MSSDIEQKIIKLEEKNNEFREAISCIRTDLAVIKEKYQAMTDKINIIDDNFMQLVETVETLRAESNNQYKTLIKTLLGGVITITASVIGAMAAIVAALL